MKTVGIIGGLGPETTAEFYLSVSLGCQNSIVSARPHILIDSVPLPFAVEKEAILHGHGEECLPFLIQSAKRLENAGADFIVMPCNTLHIFIKDIRMSVNIPVLSILEEVATFLKGLKVYQVGVLSTSITRDTRLYDDVLIQQGLKLVYPDENDQKMLGTIIHRLVCGKRTKQDGQSLVKIVENIKSGAQGLEHVILACTDLQLILSGSQGVHIHDTMKILANATVKFICGYKV